MLWNIFSDNRAKKDRMLEFERLNPYCYGISSLTLRVVKGLYSGYNSGRNDVINKIMVTFVLFKEVQMYNLI